MKNTIHEVFESLRDYLETHEESRGKMLSVFANTDNRDPNNRKERPAWLIDLKNSLSDLAESHGDEALRPVDPRLNWREVEERITSALLERKPSGRSVAIFTDLVDHEVIDLPLPVTTSAYFGIPQVKHLLSQLHRYGRYLVILFSETEHRIISIDVPLTTDDVRVDSVTAAGLFLRPGGRKARTQASDRRDLDSERRLVKEAADEINAYFMDDPDFDRIVFGGNLKIAHRVKNALHHAVSETLVSIEPIPFQAPEELVRRTVKDIANEFETTHDLALVSELVTRRATCGRVATGNDAVLEALRNGQVSKLYFAFPIDSDQFDAVFVEAVLANVEIELIHGEAAAKLSEMGGVGAILYYQIE